MFEYVIVGVILAVAAVYLGYRFLGRNNRGKCGGGCAGCSKNPPAGKAPASSCPGCAPGENSEGDGKQ